MADEKKSIFSQIFDALTGKTARYRAAAEEAARLDALARAEAAARANAAARAAAETKAAADAAATLAATQARAIADARAVDVVRQAEGQRQALDVAAQARSAADAVRAATPKHTVGLEDSLSSIALKYYGHATEPYWRLIYEYNQAAIGENPGHIHPGTRLDIPTLPSELKK